MKTKIESRIGYRGKIWSSRTAVQYEALVKADEALHTLGLHVPLGSRIRRAVDDLQTLHIHPLIENIRETGSGV